jgi:hypothetical protein
VKERFLNLNSAGGKFITAICVLLIGFPGCMWALEGLGMRAAILAWIVRRSIWSGVGLLVVFIGLILVEQARDASLYHQQRMNLNQRITLRDGYAECSNCGFRRVREFERSCSICGKELQ